IAVVEEGMRQQRQIVGQRQSADLQLQHTLIANVGPQAGVGGVFTLQCVVTDQLQLDSIELGDQARWNRDVSSQVFACVVVRHLERRRDFIVDVDIDVRKLGDQGGRIGVAEF